MRKPIAFALSLLFVAVTGVILFARTHDNAAEKKASDELSISSDITVNGTVLKAGRYQISCDTKTVRFSIVTEGPGTFVTVKKVLEVPCEGDLLPEKSKSTVLSLPLKDGVKVLDRLHIRGSNVVHTIPVK